MPRKSHHRVRDVDADDRLVHLTMTRRPDCDLGDLYVDANGCPTECVRLGDQDVIVHYDDIPETDVTTVDGIRCTTALRTVIDIAPSIDVEHLALILADAVDRQLFTVAEALERVSQPDLRDRPGARLVRRLVEVM